MLNLSDLADNPSNDRKLTDGNWQYAVACDLHTDSTFWNRASFISLSKDYAADASAALLYLLQKESKVLSLWEKQWGDGIPTAAAFVSALLAWGRFTNTNGQNLIIEKFWKSYIGTITAITSEPSFEYTEKGEKKVYAEKIIKEDILQVLCFDDSWNEQNFLIETNTEWILFNWVTMA
ncbi:hypothetical protein IQ13_3538 [Lacibacter cauensis]|uniref:Uncharacterized protein n=1 Tax=Lacibacter cauensis TaxID=510947 RepID=A0A562SCT2_9BACT|nr:hypothetical protein [Lacibacter cauensis]TWI79137.1 hypothetical protein IQ13_3538 [Lacibacter cauensis]